jgi:hypothetical protein
MNIMFSRGCGQGNPVGVLVTLNVSWRVRLVF